MISKEGSTKPRGQNKRSELYVFMIDYSLEPGGSKIFGPGVTQRTLLLIYVSVQLNKMLL